MRKMLDWLTALQLCRESFNRLSFKAKRSPIPRLGALVRRELPWLVCRQNVVLHLRQVLLVVRGSKAVNLIGHCVNFDRCRCGTLRERRSGDAGQKALT